MGSFLKWWHARSRRAQWAIAIATILVVLVIIGAAAGGGDDGGNNEASSPPPPAAQEPSPPPPPAEPPPGVYSYQEALALGITTATEWERPPGMPDCAPLPAVWPDIPKGTEIPTDAPTCYLSPEDMGVQVSIPSSDSLFAGEIPTVLSAAAE